MSKDVIDEIRPYIPATIEQMLPQPMHRLQRYWEGGDVPTVGSFQDKGQTILVRAKRGESPAHAMARVRGQHNK